MIKIMTMMIMMIKMRNGDPNDNNELTSPNISAVSSHQQKDDDDDDIELQTQAVLPNQLVGDMKKQ